MYIFKSFNTSLKIVNETSRNKKRYFYNKIVSIILIISSLGGGI